MASMADRVLLLYGVGSPEDDESEASDSSPDSSPDTSFGDSQYNAASATSSRGQSRDERTTLPAARRHGKKAVAAAAAGRATRAAPSAADVLSEFGLFSRPKDPVPAPAPAPVGHDGKNDHGLASELDLSDSVSVPDTTGASSIGEFMDKQLVSTDTIHAATNTPCKSTESTGTASPQDSSTDNGNVVGVEAPALVSKEAAEPALPPVTPSQVVATLVEQDDLDESGENDVEDGSDVEEARAAADRRIIERYSGTDRMTGYAETLRRRSMQPPSPPVRRCRVTGQVCLGYLPRPGVPEPTANDKFYRLRYPTADSCASQGFRLDGFKNGRRVFVLEETTTPAIGELQARVLKTCAGYDFVDTPRSPQIVARHADGVEQAATAEVEADATDRPKANTKKSTARAEEERQARGTAYSPASSADNTPMDTLSSTLSALSLSDDDASALSVSSTTSASVEDAWGTWPAADDPWETADPSDPWEADPWEADPGKTADPSDAADATRLPSATNWIEVNGCFVVRPSALGGLGAFALRDLLIGEHVLVEAPLLRTRLFHLLERLRALSPAKQAEFYSLTGHHPDPAAVEAERIWTANTFVAGNEDGVFTIASRFNHACTPANNIGYHYDRRAGVLVMTAIRRIHTGDELLITYGKSPAGLFERFGFRCQCGACAGYPEGSEYRGRRAW